MAEKILSYKQLLLDNKNLHSRLIEVEEALSAFQNGETDAIVFSGNEGEKIFSLTSEETPYRVFIEKMSEGAVTLNSEGVVLYCNQRFAVLVNESIENIIGSSFLRFLGKGDKQTFNNLLKNGIKEKAELRIILQNHNISTEKILRLSLNSSPLESLGALCIIITDITEFLNIEADLHNVQATLEEKVVERTAELGKKMEELVESEIKYRGLYNSIRDAILIADNDRKIIECNQSFSDLFGYSLSEIINKETVYVYENKGQFAELGQALQRHLGDASPFLYTVNYKKKNGEIFPGETSIYFLKDNNGNTTGFIGLIRDVTERIKKEIELKMLSTAIEQSVEVIVITDTSGNIQYINPAFEKVTGYSRDEVIGRNPRLLKCGKQNDAFYIDLWETISKGLIWRGIMINRCKNGSLYTEEAIISPLLDESANVSHYVAVKRNVSKELELEGMFRQAQKMESIGMLAGGIAHDFNNILTIIKSYSELLMGKLSKDKELSEFVLRIDEAADRATALTRQLLAFGRKQVMKMEPVCLNNLITNMESIMKRLMGEEYYLFTDLKAGPSVIDADPHQIEQIVMNLCVNARDAMPSGGKVYIRTRNMEKRVALIVEDTGEGIAPEVLPNIFEPFFTTKNKDKGTGLGLSVIYGIVTQHNAEIQVDSPSGKGAVFCIKFKPSVSKVENNEKETVDIVYQGGRNILFLEDDEIIREITQMRFEEKNFTVFSAESITEALKIFHQHMDEIDIVFSDVVLPDGSGLDFVDRITSKKEDMKVILTSGYTDEKSHLERILKKGFQFIQKPYTPDDVLQLISAGNNEEGK
ncbi:PAS domain S-box protein [Oceanispirochaeta sp.]|jgi:two-component system cell cycle sensor histidine kinase/response regulator CckA|uniref:PAS domain-containing hybrid sensor histidine kinase/response regulator n=1 Tax=Oceanispirochaeta sp. TaxID=2035350 RepID=UPI00261551A5|nr:PAS domain S-box protein [Oceanispirochaeta sp.]MDA3958012.1 PAS domain S-box protein [Oceanispirochaeta sp.]